MLWGVYTERSSGGTQRPPITQFKPHHVDTTKVFRIMKTFVVSVDVALLELSERRPLCPTVYDRSRRRSRRRFPRVNTLLGLGFRVRCEKQMYQMLIFGGGQLSGNGERPTFRSATIKPDADVVNPMTIAHCMAGSGRSIAFRRRVMTTAIRPSPDQVSRSQLQRAWRAIHRLGLCKVPTTGCRLLPLNTLFMSTFAGLLRILNSTVPPFRSLSGAQRGGEGGSGAGTSCGARPC